MFLNEFWESFEKILKMDQKMLRQKVIKQKNEKMIFVHTNNPENPLVFRELMKFIHTLQIGTNVKFSQILKKCGVY